MNRPILQPDEIASHLKTRFSSFAPWLGVLIVYEDSDSCGEAMDLFKYLTEGIGPEHSCNLQIWKLGEIGHPKVEEGVIGSLQTAAMVIFAARVDYQLPTETRAALEFGLANRQEKEGALVALLGDSHGPEHILSDLHLYLRDAAWNAGLKYFPRTFVIQPNRPAYSIGSIHHRAETITSTLRAIMESAPPQAHCGINE